MALMDNEEGKKRIKDMIDALTNTPIINFSRNYYAEYQNRFSAIPAEVDEDGNVYGYKVLTWDTYAMRFHSLVYLVYWSTQLGELTADRPPCEENRNGIYFMKQLNDPEIYDYFQGAKVRSHREQEFVFIVRCVLMGRIVEAERGFRVEHARIEGVYNNGYWKTYQDFRAEAKAHMRRSEPYEISYKDWEKITRYDYTARDADPLPRLARTDEDSTAD